MTKLDHVVYALQVEHFGSCDLDAEIYIRVGHNNPVLLSWMRDLNVAKLAILTSTNPGGQVLPDHENHVLWTDLVGVIHESGDLDFELVASRPGCGDQESETQMAVLNIDRAHATTIAQRFRQAAFVWVERAWTAPPATLAAPSSPFEICVPELVMVSS